MLLLDWINQEDRPPPAGETEMILDLVQRVCVKGGAEQQGRNIPSTSSLRP